MRTRRIRTLRSLWLRSEENAAVGCVYCQFAVDVGTWYTASRLLCTIRDLGGNCTVPIYWCSDSGLHRSSSMPVPSGFDADACSCLPLEDARLAQ